MNKIATMDELRIAIANLEDERYHKEQSIRLGIRYTLDSLRPANLVRKTFGSLVGGIFSPRQSNSFLKGSGDFKTRLLQTAAAMGTSFLVRKFFHRKPRDRK